MSTPANFPDVGVPLTDPKTGRLSPVWLQFLITLFTRSGGESGGDTSNSAALFAELIQQIESLVPVAVTSIASDADAPVPVSVNQSPEPESFVPTHGIQDAPDLHALATSTAAGFMSSTDKAKLDGISATVEDKFVSGTGFTPGTTTSLTLSKAYTSTAAVMVHFDGAFQGSDQYTIAGNTITFTSAIPVGTQTVYARG
jgi:hypothetical protein